MTLKIEIDQTVVRVIESLDRSVAAGIIRFMKLQLTGPETARRKGIAVKNPTGFDFYKFRVGKYRLFGHIEAEKLTILVFRVGSRRDLYH